MSKLFERTDGIACRACGAASARSVHETFKDAIFDTVCDVCWRRFSQYCENQHKTATEDLFNRWLARQLFMDVRRLKHYGVAGRCEAVTTQGVWRHETSLRAGYQCGMHASMVRDGRKVCHAHGTRADFVCYVDEPITDPYDDWSHLMADVALKDDDFLRAMKDAIECAEALRAPKAETSSV